MKKTVVNDIRIEIDPPSEQDLMGYWLPKGDEVDRMEVYARRLEAWARDFEDFVRDHRSQDPVDLSVIRDEVEVCSYCTREWEEDEDGAPTCCDEAVRDWEQGQISEVATK